MTMPGLSTERLTLRGWRDDDLDALAAIDSDPDVMRYIGVGSVRTRDETAAAIAAMRRGWNEQEFWIFATERRDTGELAGSVGLAIPRFLPQILPAGEIGWRLGRGHWGLGFATEAAREVMRFAFADVGLDRLVSICHLDNHASVRVMTKLGMRPDRIGSIPSRGRPVRVLAITHDEFDAKGRTASSLQLTVGRAAPGRTGRDPRRRSMV